MSAATPLVSCICVTENRAAFMPWLLWNFERQRWPNKELIIVDSSNSACEFGSKAKVIKLATGTSVPVKRNAGLDAASGEFITWFDDDDWQHPEKLKCLVDAMADGVAYAGATKSWFVDLNGNRCNHYGGAGARIIFNSAGFRRDAVQSIRFPEQRRRASDTAWLRNVKLSCGNGVRVELPLFFWLCHTDNLSNPATRKRFRGSMDALRSEIGESGWGDTNEALASLQERIKVSSPDVVAQVTNACANVTRPESSANIAIGPAPVSTTDFPQADESAPPAVTTDNLPPVGVMIKACALDTEYLEFLTEHMVTQANYEFAERIIVVDRNDQLLGKYRNRTQHSSADFDRALARILDVGLVDQVIDVDYRPKTVGPIMSQYFGDDAERVGCYAETGGPIFATLFGLEAMSTDHVLQMDSDVFFHTDSSSWVEKALRHLVSDPSLWLMMTHPGPPKGPVGHSMARPNTSRSRWDPARKLFLFQSATTRYFLCDRRRLYGKLVTARQRGGCAPLEQCIGEALKRNRSYRGALGDLTSWHLHAWYHGDPFVEWLPKLGAAVRAGLFPDCQRGEYDLRLDVKSHRESWDQLLNHRSIQKAVPNQSVAPRAHGPSLTAPPTTDVNKQSLLSVVVPFRDRDPRIIERALVGLAMQTCSPAEVIVVDGGSTEQGLTDVADVCARLNATLLQTGPSSVWNKSRTLNAGIRASVHPLVMTMDCDIILAPDFCSIVQTHLGGAPQFLICRCLDLPRRVNIPMEPEALAVVFDSLRDRAQARPRHGTGAIQAASRDCFFAVRGYDEQMLWWGAMDTDMVRRAERVGFRTKWIDGETSLVHQWHPRKTAVLQNAEHVRSANHAWKLNHKILRSDRSVQRNNENWGIIPSFSSREVANG